MKKALGVTCIILGALALVGGTATIILQLRNKKHRIPLKLPEEIQKYAEKHIKFGGGNI